MASSVRQIIRYRPWGSFILFALYLFSAVPAGALAPSALEPGVYQFQDKATCELKPQKDGSWQMVFWQGNQLSGPQNGFAYMGRLVPDASGHRLSGTWQSLPGSCCPGRGRGELQVLAGDAFRFVSFAPELDSQAWSVIPLAEFKKVADLPPERPESRLAGGWRVFMWYTDLLPQGAPADPVSGSLILSLEGSGAAGTWHGRPGKVVLEPTDSGIHLAYQDAAAGFEITASMQMQAGGLGYSGPFVSTLGQGEMRLIRQGLPANPPGLVASAAAQQAGPSGAWVDPRTGNDFFEIKGSGQGFDFTAYGGSLERPRYLSRGQARLTGEGTFQGQARDVEGQCCGNQGRLAFRLLSPDRLEISTFWWPQNQPDPGSALGSAYVLERLHTDKAAPTATVAPGAVRWPVVHAGRPGLMTPPAGSVKVRFIWRPQGEPREYTLFSRGGYFRDLDLFITPQGKLAARLTTGQGTTMVVAEQQVSADQPHEAWLIWQGPSKEEGSGPKGEVSPGQVELILDGEPAGSLSLDQPWVGSNSPYLVGASRWPGRSFSGDIHTAELWHTAQDPSHPLPADLTITPALPGAQPAKSKMAEVPTQLPLLRLWHPRRLVHAYAAGTGQAERLKPLGFVMQGPLGRILTQPAPGTIELWAHRHRAKGYTILSLKAQTPPGCDTMGKLGYVWGQARAEATQLMELQVEWPDNLVSIKGQDRLYTTSEESAGKAEAAGYQKPTLLCYLLPAKEPEYQAPMLFNWEGSWQGEGWGRFFISRVQDKLVMFWYYSRMEGPHYFGRYRLAPGAKNAQGIAVGRPGKQASYYRHKLEFITDDPKGPGIKLTSWRLAAPLDDGRLVLFKKPQFSTTYLRKASQIVPPRESAVLEPAAGPSGAFPAQLLDEALKQARQAGKLLER